MCAICGCGQDHEHDAAHAHDHDHHDHDHDHDHHDHAHAADGRVIRLERDLLAKNNLLAERNRGWLAGRGVVAFNLVSSPGAGKTSLLERTIHDLHGEAPMFVIEGDQATDRDARRVRAAGAQAVQINTGTGCHLDAAMVARALSELDPPTGALLFIENVGNLVCPALFDLGEARRVLVVSVTEGDDKPYKYPHMFRSSDLVVLSKEDLLPHVSFDVDAFTAAVHEVHPRTEILRLSATRGDGLNHWYAWLRALPASPGALPASPGALPASPGALPASPGAQGID
jgi:hydrogenase nickel incorporation protein HypB